MSQLQWQGPSLTGSAAVMQDAYCCAREVIAPPWRDMDRPSTCSLASRVRSRPIHSRSASETLTRKHRACHHGGRWWAHGGRSLHAARDPVQGGHMDVIMSSAWLHLPCCISVWTIQRS